MAKHPGQHPGYETKDASVRGILILMFSFALFGAALGIALKAGFDMLKTRYRGEVSVPETFHPPEPRLEIDEPANLRAYLRREQRLLESYGKNKKGRHIPIERAMELLSHE